MVQIGSVAVEDFEGFFLPNEGSVASFSSNIELKLEKASEMFKKKKKRRMYTQERLALLSNFDESVPFAITSSCKLIDY